MSYLLPIVIFAEENKCTGGEEGSDGVKICSPFTDDVGSLIDLLKIILKGITYVSVPILVLGFIYAGFRLVSAQGDTNKLSEAKRVFGYTVIAALIILGSNVILTLVQDTADAILK